MRLDPDVVHWLSANLPGGLVAETDLVDTYSFDHPLNAWRELVLQEIGHLRTPPCMKWRLKIKEPNGDDILDPPLQRRVFGNIPLEGDGPAWGAVVSNDAMHVAEQYQRQGLGRALYASEAALFAQWGIREIHLTAIDQGRVIWLKSFGFMPVNAPLLENEYRSWQAKNPRFPQEPPDHPSDYPDPFLCSVPRIMLFKELP